MAAIAPRATGFSTHQPDGEQYGCSIVVAGAPAGIKASIKRAATNNNRSSLPPSLLKRPHDQFLITRSMGLLRRESRSKHNTHQM